MRLRSAAESRVRGGHPWIFSDSIREQNREGTAGELAVVFDRNDNFLAVGLYDPHSPIRIRVIHQGKPVRVDSEWWRLRLQQSLERRAAVQDSETNGLRWINGESDSFPGLVLDQYADTFVVKLYSDIWFIHLEEISRLVYETFHPGRLILRLSRNVQARANSAGWVDGSALIGEPPLGPVVFLESGLKFEADVIKGQKTGFFLDQRENRRAIARLSRGKDVLNAFSFSGGFSVHAARRAARSVTDVDISAHALESSRRNFALNEPAVSATKHHCVQADVFEWIQNAPGDHYDVVILDPPSLAKREADRVGAIAAYGRLAENGIRLVREQGVVLCCSCSAHVSGEEFFSAVQRSALKSRRSFEVIETRREPPDHHATFPEAEYLKAIYLRVL